jgi:hypothetical protein
VFFGNEKNVENFFEKLQKPLEKYERMVYNISVAEA